MPAKWLISLTSSALVTCIAATATAQQVKAHTSDAANNKEEKERHPGSLQIGLGLGTSTLEAGSDRNAAFGHSGATFHIAPEVATRFGNIGLFGATLRLDANDGLYEVGVPLLLSMGLERQGWLDVVLEMSVGFDHLGAAMSIGAPDNIAFTSQATTHMHLGLRRGRFGWGLSAGNKHYKTRFSEQDRYARHWNFAQTYLSFQVNPRLALAASSQAQVWSQTAPGDRMVEGERSMTHELSVNAKVTDEVSLRAHGGVRQDAPGRGHRPFAGAEATWSPTFGANRQKQRASPSVTPSRDAECDERGEDTARACDDSAHPK